MLKIYKNLSLKNKIVLITLFISLVTTFIGILTNYFYELSNHEETLKNNTLTQAKLISQYCALPLALDYPEEAEKVLEKLNTLKHIRTGILYKPDKSVYAFYQKNPTRLPVFPEQIKTKKILFRDNNLHLLQPVIYKGQYFGDLYLIARLDLSELAFNKLQMSSALLFFMIVLALILSYLLHGLISRPIVALSKFTEKITTSNDYNLRVHTEYNDETGKLYHNFNNMLERIHERDVELFNLLKSFQDSEKKYKELFEANKDGITLFYINPDETISNIIKTNYSAASMLGYTVEEMSEFNVAQLEVIDDRHILIDRINDLKNNQFTRFQTRLIHKNGFEIPVEIDAVVIFYNDRPAVMNIVRDISERSVIDNTYSFLLHTNNLRNELDFFHALARYLARTLSMDFICIDRLSQDHLEAIPLAVYSDGKWEDNIKYTLKDTPCGDVVGKEICVFPKNVSELFPKDEVLQEMNAQSYLGTTLWSSDNRPIGLIAVISRQELKNPHLCESVLKLVAVRAAAELERLESENELRESEEKYRRLSENISDVVWILNTDSMQFTYVSPSVIKLRGYTPEETINQDFDSVIPNDETIPVRELITKRISDYYAGRVPKDNFYTDEIRQTRKDGSTVWTEVVTTIYFNEKSETLEILGVSRDISERKQAERAILESQRLGAIGEMSSAIAHDFNNSLQTIFGNLELALLNPAIPDTVRNYLEIIKTSTSDAATRVQLLQRFGGKKHASSNYFVADLNEIVKDVIVQSRPVWKANMEKLGFSVNIQTEYGTDSKIIGNEGELRAVLYNLVKNCIEAMPSGGDIFIKTFSDYENVYLSIKDSGLGMEDNIRERIFQPFFTTKGFEIGRGLGLSGAYSIIKEHGGIIRVAETRPGYGTTMEIVLPKAGSEEESLNNSVTENTLVLKANLLWVDDDQMIRDLAVNILNALGHAGDVVSSGEEALTMLEKKNYDLVITDIGMPGMSGWELADKIKTIYNGKMKVAVQTGWGDQIDENKRQQHSVGYILTKPFKIAQVKNLINEALQFDR